MRFAKLPVVCLVIFSVFFTSMSFPAAAAAKTKKVKIHGYITSITSPKSFEIDDYRVTKDDSIVLDFENKDEGDVQFKPEDIRVGTEIEVQGMLNEETDELTATKVTIDLDQFRTLKNTTLLARPPEGVQKLENGWQGVFWADGRRIRIEPATQVLFEMNKGEKKAVAKSAKKDKDDAKKAETADEFAGTEPLKDIADVKAGMFVTYEGKEQSDGTVTASRIVFMKNEMEKGELNFWKSLKLKEKAPNFAESNPGELSIKQVGKFKLLPNKEVQDYVSNLGNSLVPAYQKQLPENHPQKIPFKFYVITEKRPNAFALANGVVVIHSSMITSLENEAQLAAVVSHEIAHATQEHTWRPMNKDKGKRAAVQIGGLAAAVFGLYGVQNILQLTLAAMVNGYQRRLENQSDRIGLEYMTAAGYDPREAPRVWKVMAKKFGDAPTNVFWSSHDSNATRRSFLMVEIRNNYSNMDFERMKRGEEEYEKIIALTKDAAAKKKKIKVVS